MSAGPNPPWVWQETYAALVGVSSLDEFRREVWRPLIRDGRVLEVPCPCKNPRHSPSAVHLDPSRVLRELLEVEPVDPRDVPAAVKAAKRVPSEQLRATGEPTIFLTEFSPDDAPQRSYDFEM